MLSQDYFAACFEITLITLRVFYILTGFFHVRVNFRCLQIFCFPLQEFILSSGISPYGRGTEFLLHYFRRGALHPGVQGKVEAGTNIQAEVEGLTLAYQRLAEIQALVGHS